MFSWNVCRSTKGQEHKAMGKGKIYSEGNSQEKEGGLIAP